MSLVSVPTAECRSQGESRDDVGTVLSDGLLGPHPPTKVETEAGIGQVSISFQTEESRELGLSSEALA